jgi:hypothetical protein
LADRPPPSRLAGCERLSPGPPRSSVARAKPAWREPRGRAGSAVMPGRASACTAMCGPGGSPTLPEVMPGPRPARSARLAGLCERSGVALCPRANAPASHFVLVRTLRRRTPQRPLRWPQAGPPQSARRVRHPSNACFLIVRTLRRTRVRPRVRDGCGTRVHAPANCFLIVRTLRRRTLSSCERSGVARHSGLRRAIRSHGHIAGRRLSGGQPLQKSFSGLLALA